jgi:poly(3-hydroxybutyrate) depolymerase
MKPAYYRLPLSTVTVLLTILGLTSCTSLNQGRAVGPVLGPKVWPQEISQIKHTSSADSTPQPAFFYTPKTKKPVPLLVALHTWSGNYRQNMSIPYAQWCIDKGWAFIHPNFRGPNRNPRATGSELVVADIISAVDYAKTHANVDTSRIYLVGVSGGGYTSLLMAARAPDVISLGTHNKSHGLVF